MTLLRLSSLTAVLVLAACSEATAPVEPDDPPWPTPEYAVLYGGGLRLSIFEAPGERPADSAGDWTWSGVREPRIVLALKTFREWGGCGAWLEAEVSQQANVTTVTAGRVLTSVLPCTGRAWPTANYKQFLSLPEGESTLLLDVLSRPYEYRVRVSLASIDLARVTPRLPDLVLGPVKVVEEMETFWRFPPNSASVHCQATVGSCGALFDELAAEPGFERHHFPAWGHPPFPRPNSPGSELAYFLYGEAGGFTRLREFLCRAAPQGSGRAAIALSWRNEEAISLRC